MKGWHKVLVKIMLAIFPGSEDLPGLDPLRTERFLEQFLREAPLLVRLGLHGSALAFLLSTPLTVGRLQPALSLRPDLLDRHTHAVACHPNYWVRQSMMLLKTVGGMCWGADSEVRRALGLKPYDPDPGTRKQP